MLFYETIEILNFPLYDNISKYTQKQLDEFLDAFLEIQESYKSYVCISSDVHKKFHDEFGYGDNTEKQWNEFINKYYK